LRDTQERHGAGIVLRLNKTEFVVLGSGFDVRCIKPEGQGVSLARVESGRFVGSAWQLLLPIAHERSFPAGVRRLNNK
jgi:hypothetical protein